MTIEKTILRATAIVGFCFAITIVSANGAYAQADCKITSAATKNKLINEHVLGGVPSKNNLLVRRGYVTDYDDDHRIPIWTAWRVEPDFLETPERKGKWKAFRTDPDIKNPVVDDDYLGLEKALGYARGHMAPYFVSGGDRNKNKKYATTDNYDACTIFEINYMSNIAPQLHNEFNGSGGLWYRLETHIRQDIAGNDKSIHVIAGTILGKDDAYVVGPSKDIFVPNMFYQILIAKEGAVPFLFVQHTRVGTKGCDLDAKLESCIVRISDVEKVAGLKLFPDLTAADKAWLENSNGLEVWKNLIGADEPTEKGTRKSVKRGQ